MLDKLRIGLVLYPDCMPAGLLAFADMLHAANRRTGRVLFEARYVGVQSGSVTCAHGMVLSAPHGIAEITLDAVLIPGFWAESAQQVEAALAANGPLLKTLARLDKRCGIWSYCTGVSLAAASGRLHGEDATVTWWLADALLKRYPGIRWQSERSCIFNHRNATASGVNGYLPIAQTLIEQHLNPTAFHDLIRLMVLPRPTRAQDVFQSLSLIEQPSELLRRLHGIVQKLPADQLTVHKLADELGMSGRTLARKVSRETGAPVATYARRIKLNQISERLTLTSTPIKSISDDLGFSSDANMRRMFKEVTGLTPTEYRERFARF